MTIRKHYPPGKPYLPLGRRIRELRERNVPKIPQRDLDVEIGMKESYIGGVESGRMRPDPDILRRIAVAALTTDDVDWVHSRLTVIGKGNKQRQVRVSAATQRHLDKYLRARRKTYPECPWLFHGRGDGPLSPDGISGLHDRLSRAVGFHCHPHKWRHTAAQAMLDSGMEREYVRLVLGHEDEATLRQYVRQTDARRALEAHRKHSPVDSLLG